MTDRRRVVVVGDHDEAEAVLRDAGLAVTVLPADRLSELPSDVGAVYLAGSRPEDVPAVAALVGVPVVSDLDTTAIAGAAMVLATLAAAGRPPHAARVVVAGADAVPALAAVLIAGGVGEITVWRPRDAIAFPLRRVAASVDIVVDLVGAARPGFGAVVLAGGLFPPLLALPGLVRGLVAAPGVRADVNVLHACALAVVMATPPDRRLPDATADLGRRIADAVLRAPEQPSSSTKGDPS